MNNSREDLLQTLVQRMMSVMRHVRHGGPPEEMMLHPAQLHLLFTIGHNKDGISVKELAEEASVTPGAITQFIDALVERGFVMREGDPVDRRVVRLKLTELAKSQFEKFRADHLASFCRVFEVLTDDEIKQLIAIMAKIDTSHAMKDRMHAEYER